jgi:hypothetical protein
MTRRADLSALRKPATRLAGTSAAATCTTIACISLLLAACSNDSVDRNDSAPREVGAVAELADALSALDDRAQRLRDAADIKRLQRAYGHYVDRAWWHDVADLFAEDASVEFGNDGVWVGRERIREYFLRLGNGETGLQHGQINNHMQLQPVVHIADDGLTAQGRWRAFSMVGQFGEKALWAEGPYENEYVKEDGVWKISRLRWYPTFVVPYEEGWSGSTVDSWHSPAAGEDFAPDREADESLPLFPDVYVAPFHYPHPSSRPVVHADDDPQLTISTPAADEAAGELHALLTERRTQLARLEAWEAVENLQAAYGYYFDRQLWDDVAALFSGDATFEYGQSGVYRGRDSIRRGLMLFGDQGPEHGRLNNHFQLQPLITVADDGRSARARWRGLNQTGVHGEYGEWSEGVYENEYVLEDGVWRISRLHFYVTVIADYERGWGNDPKPMPGPSERIPPDAPPTEVYESLPGVHIPPFHYDHPVAAAGRPTRPGMNRWTPTATEPAPAAAWPPWLTDLHRTACAYRSHAGPLAGRTRDRGPAAQLRLLRRQEPVRRCRPACSRQMARWKSAVAACSSGGSAISEYLHWLTPAGPQYNQIFNHTQFQPVLTVNGRRQLRAGPLARTGYRRHRRGTRAVGRSHLRERVRETRRRMADRTAVRVLQYVHDLRPGLAAQPLA